MIPLSCGGSTCPPLDQYVVNPLSAGGLCDAEIITPTPHPRCRTANDNSGVERCSAKKNTFKPFAASVVAVSRPNSADRFRVSCATTARPPCPPLVDFRYDASPCALSATVRSLIVAL